MTGESPLLIRADATASMGTGHAMRCLALAQAWQDAGGCCIFAMADVTPAVRRKVEEASCEVVAAQAEAGSTDDATQFIRLAQERNATRVVVDGYQFGADYQRALKSAGLRILFIDDYGHAGHYSADLVLNQNVSADERLYANRESYTRLLPGPRYALLRREFNAWRDHKREIPSIGCKVLITFGGSDPEGLTSRAIEALAAVKADELEVIAVVGGSNPQFEQLGSFAAKLATHRDMKIALQRDVANMAELMAWADVAISAAGSTCWELCLLSLPALIIDVADNQSGVARELHRLQCAVHVGRASEISAEQMSRELETLLRSNELRQSLSTRSRELVDGNGARRVVSALRDEAGVHLRRAREDDCKLLFDWANDIEVRNAAFSSAPITWESHVAWFSGKLHAGRSFIWIAEDAEGSAVGQIRFDIREDSEAEVDVSIARTRRGQGFAHALIRLGSNLFLQESDCKLVHAFVKETNDASARAFERADFKRAGTRQIRGMTAIHFTNERS